MRIVISQQGKKILINFKPPRPFLTKEGIKGRWIVDSYTITKAEDFLAVIDRFVKKRKIKVESLKKASLEFENVGLLTERVIRAIMLGLCF